MVTITAAIGTVVVVRRKPVVGKDLRWLGAWLVAIAMPFAGVVFSAVIPVYLNNRKVTAAREYCDALIPRLESHRVATGSYPQEIAIVENGLRRSDLIHEGSYARGREGTRYRLAFCDPTEGMSGFPQYVYDSQEASWMAFDNPRDFGFDPDQLEQYWR